MKSSLEFLGIMALVIIVYAFITYILDTLFETKKIVVEIREMLKREDINKLKKEE